MTPALASVLDRSSMLLVCGSGGVGKTTVSAALGVDAAVRAGRRVLVITVDPARRLADALGLQRASFAGTGAVPVSGLLLDGTTGDAASGQLHVAMLDTKAGWDELIRRHAPDRALAERVIANPLYHNITSRFVNSHDYLAMEQLHHLDQVGEYDLVVVDTPPSRNALDLIDAPARMREFFRSALLRWLTAPATSRLWSTAARPFNAVADRVLGARFLEDITEFFLLLRTMEPGFVARAAEVERILAGPRTTFVVVTTGEPAPIREAGHLVDELGRRGLPLGALIVNRALPESIATDDAAATAAAMAALSADGAGAAAIEALTGATEFPDAATVRHVLSEVGRRFGEVRERAAAEAARRADLVGGLPTDVVVAAALAVDGDVHDLASLAALVEGIVG